MRDKVVKLIASCYKAILMIKKFCLISLVNLIAIPLSLLVIVTGFIDGWLERWLCYCEDLKEDIRQEYY